jgi:hypothetical protein
VSAALIEHFKFSIQVNLWLDIILLSSIKLNVKVPGLLTQSAFAFKILEAKVTENDKL